MKRSELPPAAFVDPSGENADVVQELVEEVLDRLLTQLTTADDRSPLPENQRIPDASITEMGRGADELTAEVETIVEGSMNPAHPGYIGHMDTIPTTVSVLGDAVAAAINNNMLSVEMSPVLSELERQLVAEIASLFGFDDTAGGVLTSGGSLANLHALIVARNRAFDIESDGMADREERPVLFASEVSHTSLQKAAMILGLGSDAVVPVETDDQSRMCPDALRTEIEDTIGNGRTPFCVVGTAGTTTTGNVDPLPELANIAEAHDIWFHVDAAYGGALVFADQYRSMLAGIDAADSITFNPQKWCYVAKTCAMALFADETVLTDSFRIGAPYMREGEVTPNFGEISVQGTRHADVLKLWLTFQHLGRTGLEQLLKESYRLTDHFHEQVRTNNALEAASDPEMNIVCFRAAPEWCPEDDQDELNSQLQQHLLREHDVFLSLPEYRGDRWLRAVLLNPFTGIETLDSVFNGIEQYLQTVSK